MERNETAEVLWDVILLRPKHGYTRINSQPYTVDQVAHILKRIDAPELGMAILITPAQSLATVCPKSDFFVA